MSDSPGAASQTVSGGVDLRSDQWTNVGQLLSHAAAGGGDSVALIEAAPARRTLTWRELDAAASRVSQALSARGLLAGQRVVLSMGNRLELAVCYFGILRGGMIAVPIAPGAAGAELALVMDESTPRIVMADDVTADQVSHAIASCEGRAPDLVVIGRSAADVGDLQVGTIAFEDFIDQAGNVKPVAPSDAELTAVLAATADRDGVARLAMLSHRALLANIGQLAELVRPAITQSDTVLSGVPMCGIYGLNAVLGLAVRQAATTVLAPDADPAELLALIDDVEVTVVSAHPDQLAAWANAADAPSRLASVRVVRSTAVDANPDIERAFTVATGHRVERGFGIVEAGPAISTTLADPIDAGGADPSAGSAGQSLPGVRVRIVDTDDSDAASGDRGEIVIAGKNLFSGYWPDGSQGPDDRGWYRTGQIGVLDAGNRLTALGPREEVITVAGFSVHAAEVEQVIDQVDGVVSVAVIGRNDSIAGQAVVAYVETSQAQPPAAVTKAILDTCSARLARFKRPVEVIVMDRLPTVDGRRIDTTALRSMAAGSQTS